VQLATASPCTSQILAYVNKVREVGCSVDNAAFTLEEVESTPVRCPDPEAAERMYQGVRQLEARTYCPLILSVMKRWSNALQF
jgi:chorismate synthase